MSMITIFRVIQTSFHLFTPCFNLKSAKTTARWLSISSTFSDEEKDKDQNSLTVKCKLENISS